MKEKELYVIQMRDNKTGNEFYLKKPKSTSSVYYWVDDLQDATTYNERYAKKQVECKTQIDNACVVYSAVKVKLVKCE